MYDICEEAGGIVECPKNATRNEIELSDFIVTHSGGDESVIEFIEWILELI